jgi:peroxiredoxin Q/BCP
LALIALAAALGACTREEPRPVPAPSAASQTSLLAEGAPVPALKVESYGGEELELRALGKPAVVYFYPRDDTPGCTVEATEIRDLYGEIAKTGAVVIGVSTDGQSSHKAFAEKHALPFLLVSDEDHEVAKAFGVPVKDGKAARVTFIAGADGIIKKVFPKVTPKGHGAEVVAALSSR